MQLPWGRDPRRGRESDAAKGIRSGVDDSREMRSVHPTHTSHEQVVDSVQAQVANGAYVVDAELVATAMLERIGTTISHQELVTEAEGGRTLLQALSDLRAA